MNQMIAFKSVQGYTGVFLPLTFTKVKQTKSNCLPMMILEHKTLSDRLVPSCF